MGDVEGDPVPASERTTLRRGAGRAVYDRDEILAILDAGVVAHVGAVGEHGPIVLPMAYGRDDAYLYLHGAMANAILRAGRSAQVCVTVSVLDGLIFARTPFHNSMAYRSVVVRGEGRLVDDPDDKREALRIITDHVVRHWDGQRPPTAAEVRRTQVLAVPLAEASAKVRPHHPADEPEDVAGPHWAGTVPVHRVYGAPIPAPDLAGSVPVPPAIAQLAQD